MLYGINHNNVSTTSTTLPSVIVGGVNYQILNFFPPTSIYYHPPICEDFEKVRPPLIIANPPNLIESRWMKKCFVLVEGF